MRSRLPIIGISLGFALLTLIPYGLAYQSAGEYRFTGFLFNPYDAASYLAKMREGYDGQFLYTLAFTDDPGSGALFFPFYLLLGRLARLCQLPLIGVWQIARVLGAAAFLIIAWEFFGRTGLNPRGRAIAWIITLFGSGFGFLVVPFGAFTADLWVAEYIPFLGMLTSSHFPLAIGLILLLAMRIALPARRQTPASLMILFLLGTVLGAIQPFGFLPLGLTLCIWMLWERARSGRFPQGSISGLAAAAIGILPWVAYDLWITQTLPQFASWFSQNETPTPPVWDVFLSLGVPGFVAAVYFFRWILSPGSIRNKLRGVPAGTFFLGLWVSVNLVMLYAPIPLQRRLMMGLWIPLAALAAFGIEAWLFQPSLQRRRILYVGAPLIATNLVFLAAIRINAISRNPLLFLNPDTAAAVSWLDANARGSVVLARPEISLWLPGMAGVRVVYGHGMETPYADRALKDAEAFFNSADEAARATILAAHHVDWILCSADEPTCAESADGSIQEAFRSSSVIILAVLDVSPSASRPAIPATHNLEIAGQSDRIIALRDGRVLDG
jgi:hypothetical protein